MPVRRRGRDILEQTTRSTRGASVRLFKREKSQGTSCPRCSQIVADGNGDVCPMCGWDDREACQGRAKDAVASDPADESSA